MAKPRLRAKPRSFRGDVMVVSLARGLRQLHKLEKNNLLVNFGVFNCLIWTKTATLWSKNYQDAMKRPRFYCTVRVQPNHVPQLISLFAGLVPQRGARDPETTSLCC